MPPPRSVPFAIRKYRERGYSASGPGSHLGGGGEHHTPATQDDRRGEFEVRYPHYGGDSHPDKASIAQALASLPSNIKSLNLSGPGGSNRHYRSSTTATNGDYQPNSLYPTAHRQGSTPSPTSSSPNHTGAEQRIPNEDDFPTLGGPRSSSLSSIGGSTHGLSNGNGNGHASTLLNGSGKTAAQILKSSLPTGAVSGKFRPRDRDSGSPGIGAGASAGPGASIVGAAVSKSSPASIVLAETASSVASASASEKTTDVDSLKSGGTDQITRPTSPEDAVEVSKPASASVQVTAAA